ncbi:MAG: M56 family metallopeptidase [Muribaculaceae bacterium]|nr:M56 family metallopeptidase [Muribaculaceae bacterium]
MGEYIVWLLVSAVTMIALYACYCLLLSRQRQATFNRAVILAIYVVSFLALPVYRLLDVPVIDDGEIRVIGVSTISKTSMELNMIWLHIAFWVYVAGAVVMLMRRIWSQITMMRLIANGERSERDGYEIVTVDDDNLSPFSWRKYVVVGRHDCDDDLDMIITHEMSHLKARHWIDLLVADVVQIVQWFNPVAWMMRDELKDIHEFQADERVVSAGYDVRKYQLMLIGKVIGRKVCFAGNNLSHGKLKRRLSMMNVKPSGKYIRLRVMAFVPLVMALAVFANNTKCKIFCGHIVSAYNYRAVRTMDVDSNNSDGPAVFVDGKRVSSDDLNQINPSDIRAITVRKNINPAGEIYVETK